MLKRIKASLANPSSISLFRKDNIGLVLLYIFFLCFIASVPTLINSAKKNNISMQTKYQLREFMVEERKNFPKGTIENNTLTITSESEGFYLGDMMAVLLPTDEIDPVEFVSQNIYYVLKINDHNVEIYFVGNKVKTYTYTELGLDNFDLGFIDNTNYKERTAEFERLEAACDKVFRGIKPIWATFNVIAVFFRVLMVTIIFDLICALLTRGIKGLSFREVFTIALYAFVMEIIGQIIDELYGFTIFTYIGGFIGIIYYVIAIRGITVLRIDEK